MWRRVDLVWTDVSETAATWSRWFFARGFFYPEGGGDTFLRNVSSHKIYTTPQPKKTTFFIVTAVKTSNLTYYIRVLSNNNMAVARTCEVDTTLNDIQVYYGYYYYYLVYLSFI
jgi:hypothetical protein